NVVEYYTVTFKISPKNGNTSIDIVTEEFSLKWRVNKALFDLTNVKWDYTTPLPYNDKNQEVVLTGLPNGLTAQYRNNKKMAVDSYTASVLLITVTDENLKKNYIQPEVDDSKTYKGEVEWTLEWEIVKGELQLDWNRKQEEDKNGKTYSAWEVTNTDKIEYLYYTEEGYAGGAMSGEPVSKEDIIVPEEQEEKVYWIVAVVKGAYESSYDIKGSSAMPFTVGSMAPIITITMDGKYTYDGKEHGREWYNTSVPGMEHVTAKYYKVEEDGSETLLEELPKDAGKYIVRLDIEEEYVESYQLSVYKIEYEIKKAQILAVWNTEGEIPVIENATQVIEYEYSDEEGNIIVDVAQLEKGKKYTAVAKIKSEYVGNYEFVGADGIVLAEPTVTEGQEFEIKAEEPTDPEDPNDP
ncbi:MAG: hypothetical protein K2H36_03740, partial [Clostridia bacterium]|nr:hypothetical protein [Clostridia bacterium]